MTINSENIFLLESEGSAALVIEVPNTPNIPYLFDIDTFIFGDVCADCTEDVGCASARGLQHKSGAANRHGHYATE